MIFFARTRHEYPSYSDFWRLVELSGYETVYTDEIDPYKHAVYIFTPLNGDVIANLEAMRNVPRRCTLIWWFLERLDSTPMLQDGSFDQYKELVDTVWVSDRWEAAQHPMFKYVVLGSHPELGNDPLPAQYDFTHQSYVHGRRERVMQALRQRLVEGPNGWGGDRDRVLRSSRCMVHVHQYDLALYTPIRFALSAAYALPLVSESLLDPFPLDGLIEQAPYDGLVDATARVAEAPGDRGSRLFQALCIEHTFRVGVEAAL